MNTLILNDFDDIRNVYCKNSRAELIKCQLTNKGSEKLLDFT